MKGLLLICLMATSGLVLAQQRQVNTFKHNVFLELLGNGGYASLNYQRSIYERQRLCLAASAGISTFKTKDFEQNFNPDLIIPISLRLYYGSFRHKIVFGAGQTWTSTAKLNTEDFNPKRSYGLSANLMLGYRYDFSRIMLQLAYTPIIENYNHYHHWAGFAIGYKF